jgi:hypothetical protein
MPSWIKTYKDKDKARVIRNQQRKRNYSKTQGYPARDWTIQEMDLILNSDKSDVELSEILKRSALAIQIKRSRLKKVEVIE